MKFELHARRDRVPLLAAILVGVMAVVVLVGWWTGLPALVQIHPSFVPMQFNTALCFLLLALAMCGAIVREPGFARALGAAVATIGALTLAQYLSGRNFGIDQLLQHHYITVQTSHPGRMAPATAVGFVMMGLATFLLVTESMRGFARTGAEVMAALTVGIALVAVIGYVTGIEQAYGWGHATRMALHTAFGFLVIGLSALHFALHSKETPESGVSHRTYVPLAIVALTISLSLWQALEAHNERRILDATDASRRAIEDVYALHVASLVRALERMAVRWQQSGRTPRSEWEADAREYVKDDFLQVGWLDSDNHIRWTMQPAAVGAAGTRRIADWQRASELCAIALEQAAPAVTATVRRNQHGGNLFAAVPLVAQSRRDGCLLATSALHFLKETPALDLKRFAFSIQEADGGALWAASGQATDARWVRSSTITVQGTQWVVSVWPTEAGLADLRSALPIAILAFGIFATTLLLAALGLYQVAARRAAALTSQHNQLRDVQAELEHLALYDALTGIGNRNLFLRSFESALASAERSGQPVALLVMDLNGFKDVNDQLGHKAGDIVLTSVAERISTLLKGRGQLYRIGGDEFAVVLEAGSDQAEATEVARRIADSIAKPMELYGELRQVGVSIGIAGFPRHGRDVDAMIRKADVAMYEAKVLGEPVVANVDFGATTVLRLRQAAKLGAQKRSP